MCFGGSQPQAPQIQYVGPSDSDIRRQEQQLQTYQQQMQSQQAATAKQIQAQIDAANAETAKLQQQYDAEFAKAEGQSTAAGRAAQEAQDRLKLAEDRARVASEKAAAAGGVYTPVGAYDVISTVESTPTAETTQSIAKKKKPKSSLKISPTAVAQAGSGLNIGV